MPEDLTAPVDPAGLPGLADCLLPAARASGLPPALYADPALIAPEIARIFRRGWLCVGRADRLAGPGAYAALDIAGQRIVLLRDGEGRLRAFANACRHRGARLVDGEGSCRGLRCPFHSWFYGLDGRLVSAPRMEAAEGFDRAEHGLHAYRAAERHGFAFVSLDPAAPDLDAQLGDFAAIHAPWRLDRLVTLRRRELEVACNWKAFLEVFNEYYHLPFVHPDSIDSVYALPDPPETVTGDFATQFGATEGTGGLLEGSQSSALPPMPGLTGRAARGARYTWLFPSLAFAASSEAIWCYEAWPDPADPGRCKVVQTLCFPPETMALPGFAERSAAYLARLDAALDEDVPALVNQQAGLSCPDARPGRFQPGLEPNVAAFARWYAGRLAGPDAAPGGGTYA